MYEVGIKIYNTFEVEAKSKEHAEQVVRELGVHETLEDADYNITYVSNMGNEELFSGDINGREVRLRRGCTDEGEGWAVDVWKDDPDEYRKHGKGAEFGEYESGYEFGDDYQNANKKYQECVRLVKEGKNTEDEPFPL
jgi:hypothetical protein